MIRTASSVKSMSCKTTWALRSCSVNKIGSRVSRSRKPVSPKIIKDDGNQAKQIEIWRCEICDWEICGTMKGTRGKIRYHRKLHGFQGSVRLVSRGCLQPIPFKKVDDTCKAFRCPWCGLGICASGRVLKLSKKHHSSSCPRRPSGKITPWQFHLWGTFGPSKAKCKFLKADVRYQGLGHKPIRCEWRVKNNKHVIGWSQE